MYYKTDVLFIDTKSKCYHEHDIGFSIAQHQVDATDIPIVAHMTLTCPERHDSCNSSFLLSLISAWYTPVLIRPSLSVLSWVAVFSESYTKMMTDRYLV
jgi:hypothetical protein